MSLIMILQIVVNAVFSLFLLITAYSSMNSCKSILNGSFKGNGNVFGSVCECGLIIWGFNCLANCVLFLCSFLSWVG